jgi:hypothetical protein
MLVRSKCSRIGAGNSRDSRDPVKLAGQGPGPKHRHGRCIPSAHRSKAGHHRPAAGHSHDRLPMPMLLRRSDGPRFSMDSSSRRGEAAHKDRSSGATYFAHVEFLPQTFRPVSILKGYNLPGSITEKIQKQGLNSERLLLRADRNRDQYVLQRG